MVSMGKTDTSNSRDRNTDLYNNFNFKNISNSFMHKKGNCIHSVGLTIRNNSYFVSYKNLRCMVLILRYFEENKFFLIFI